MLPVIDRFVVDKYRPILMSKDRLRCRRPPRTCGSQRYRLLLSSELLWLPARVLGGGQVTNLYMVVMAPGTAEPSTDSVIRFSA